VASFVIEPDLLMSTASTLHQKTYREDDQAWESLSRTISPRPMVSLPDQVMSEDYQVWEIKYFPS